MATLETVVRARISKRMKDDVAEILAKQNPPVTLSEAIITLFTFIQERKSYPFVNKNKLAK